LVDASFKGNDAPHPALLTRKGTDALIQVERMLDDADHARTAEQGPPSRSLGALDTSTPDGGKRTDTFATAADHSAPISPRGD
jgi:hypothetical protein